MPRSRAAGVALCIVAGLSFLSSTPADASPAGVADPPAPVVVECGGRIFVAETNIVLPCISISLGSQAWVPLFVQRLVQLQEIEFAQYVELLVDVYIGPELEGVPFFGSGLATLAETVIVLPFRALEYLFDTFVVPLLAFVFDAVGFALEILEGAFFSVSASLWLGLMYVVATLGAAAFWIIQLPFSIASSLVEYFDSAVLDFAQAAALFVTFQSVIDAFQSLASAAMQFVTSITLDTQSGFGTVAMPGGTSVNVFGVAQTLPPALEVAMGIFSGLVVVFAVIQALGFISKITESG